ncbi:hypothetical protein ILYODFUR_038916 [Ilyodon furcidens]|uniref:Uncharacterized protein n=1 Tax=Ilyodon furcidens TaxID=33524 RepID=A0ABV0VCJ6_9TELE
MTVSKDLQSRYKVAWTSAYGTVGYNYRIRRAQGGLYLPIVCYIWEDPNRGFWLPVLHLLDGRAVAIGTHGPPGSPHWEAEVQEHIVSTTTTDKTTQTSVTTRSVTCQTSIDDNEDKDQPLVLGAQFSPISPAEEPLPEGPVPDQLSEGWLNEVMFTIPPETFSPLSPLPPVLSPILSPVETASGEESIDAVSPSPPVLRSELPPSPPRMNPDFIEEFEILDAWCPTPVPGSPLYPDYLEDGVLSLCVYDDDLAFF